MLKWSKRQNHRSISGCCKLPSLINATDALLVCQSPLQCVLCSSPDSLGSELHLSAFFVLFFYTEQLNLLCITLKLLLTWCIHSLKSPNTFCGGFVLLSGWCLRGHIVEWGSTFIINAVLFAQAAQSSSTDWGFTVVWDVLAQCGSRTKQRRCSTRNSNAAALHFLHVWLLQAEYVTKDFFFFFCCFQLNLPSCQFQVC